MKHRVREHWHHIILTAATSPVQPEKFSGYHTGVDFEMLSEEEYDADTPIYAICDGPLVRKQTADGYGGYAVQHCTLDGQAVTVIYGHLDISRITAATDLLPGDLIGYLGDHESGQTDGERKHLHLGIHKGTDINIRGYVNSEAGLDDWLNACDYVC
ncbi:MAG: M23 family metallopeptidase [Parcubacteria group bacterium]